MPSIKQQIKRDLITTSDIPVQFIPRTQSYNLGLMVCLLCNLASPEDPLHLYSYIRDKIREGKTKDIYNMVKDNKRVFKASTTTKEKQDDL